MNVGKLSFFSGEKQLASLILTISGFPVRGGTKSLIFHVTFVHTNARHCERVPIRLQC